MGLHCTNYSGRIKLFLQKLVDIGFLSSKTASLLDRLKQRLAVEISAVSP
jgi:hypothetical protein